MVPQIQESSSIVRLKDNGSNKLSSPSIRRATEVSHRLASDLIQKCLPGPQSTCALRTDDRVQRMDTLLQKSTSDSIAMQQSLTKIDHKLHTLRVSEAPTRQYRLDTPCHVNLDPRNNRFYGRNAVLDRMTQELLPANKPDQLRSFALSGMAGVGKSQTALEFVHKNINRFKAVLWVSADGRQKLAQGFGEIAKALGLCDVAVAEDQDKSIASVKRWCMTTGRSALMFIVSGTLIADQSRSWQASLGSSYLIMQMNWMSSMTSGLQRRKVP